MEVKAVEKYIRISPKKARLVADMIRGTNAKQALDILRFTNKKAAKIISKSLKSAISNAEHNKNIEGDKLIIKTISIDGGPSLKRSRPGYKGSPAPILKRTSHITVVVSDENENNKTKKKIDKKAKEVIEKVTKVVTKPTKSPEIEPDIKHGPKEKK